MNAYQLFQSIYLMILITIWIPYKMYLFNLKLMCTMIHHDLLFSENKNDEGSVSFSWFNFINLN